MKEMVYGSDNSRKIYPIDVDTYNGYTYAILNIHGSHPCCYVKLPSNHRLAKIALENYDELEISCHGGITYAEDHLNLIRHFDLIEDKWIDILSDYSGVWIGWDYAHCDDYMYDPYFDREPMEWEHKYTYEELVLDVFNVIDQIVEGDKNGDETSEL